MIDASTPPHLVTAYAALAGALIGSVGNGLAQLGVNWLRTKFERQLAERKVQLDTQSQDIRRKQEFAEELIAGFLEFRDIVSSIRSPHGYMGEGSTREKVENETPDETVRLNKIFVVRERYNKHHEAVSRLLSKKYRAATWFESKIEEPFIVIEKILDKIFYANNFYKGTKRFDVIYE